MAKPLLFLLPEFSSLVDRERPHVHYECGEGGEGTAPHGAEAGSGNFGELAEPPQGKDVEVTLDTGMSVRLQAKGLACVKTQGGEEQGVCCLQRGDVGKLKEKNATIGFIKCLWTFAKDPGTSAGS